MSTLQQWHVKLSHRSVKNTHISRISNSVTQVGKRIHFSKIYISAKTAEFVSWIPKSLILRCEWGNIKEWNEYPRALSDSKYVPTWWPKKEFILVLFQFLTSCCLPKCIILTVILFFVHGVAALPRLPDGRRGNVLLRCQMWHMVLLLAAALFAYYLPNRQMVYYLLNSIFKLKLTICNVYSVIQEEWNIQVCKCLLHHRRAVYRWCRIF